MNKYTSKSEYYRKSDGTEISKRTAEEKYEVVRRYKIVKVIDHTKAAGYQNVEIQITWINECSVKKQLNIFGNNIG